MAHQNDGPTPGSSPLDPAVLDTQPPIDPSKPVVSSSPPATGLEDATPSSSRIQEYANLFLEFLANASNESLAACLVGLGASTYFVLGRVGLVLIGIVGGIILHVTWEYSGQAHDNDHAKAFELNRRHEVGLDIVNRVLDWRETRITDQDKDRPEMLRLVSAPRQVDYSDFRPATKVALESLTDAVIRDYVKWWYTPLLPSDDSFPLSCRQTLVGFFVTFSSHLSRKRPADTFIDFLTNSSSISMVFMNELSSALMVPGASNAECSSALYRYLEQNPDSHLSNVLDVEQQHKKLKMVAEDILHTFLEPSAYSCEPVKVFLREVLAGLVLEMTVKSCSKPEFINGWIVYLLEEADSEIIDIIDAGVGGATANGAHRSSAHLNPKVEAAGADRAPNDTDGAKSRSTAAIEHKRTVSRAEDAMEEAMQEAKRLTELIAAEEAKMNQGVEAVPIHNALESTDNKSSSATTPSGPTPNSSASDLAASTQSLENHTVNEHLPSLEPSKAPSFTSFDQILPPKQTTALQNQPAILAPPIPPLTLHDATVSIFDDSQPNEKGTLRSKPQSEYLIQIEPATPQHPGWMIARRYPDFETLHEVLRRISVVSGVPAFAQKHSSLPAWKNRTKASLCSDLEHYIRDALSFSRLAESEGMKRFLEKDHGPDGSAAAANKGGFGFPSPAAFESMGKGMLDVLASAPKGAAGGGKAILGGFTGVVGGLGSIGQKKPGSVSPGRPSSSSVSSSSSHFPRPESYDPVDKDVVATRESQEGVRDPFGPPDGFAGGSPLPGRPNLNLPQQPPTNGQSADNSLGDQTPGSSKTTTGTEDHLKLHLPPPPSEIPDEYNAYDGASASPKSILDRVPTISTPNPPHTPTRTETPSPSPDNPTHSPTPPHRREAEPLTEPETRMAVELFFALINELYTLSSAWNIRRTLLNAAKSYLLRPGNPSLTSIQQLLQSSLETNTSDEAIAAHLRKLRQHSLPTDEELKRWPTPPNEEDKEELRRKARKLLVEKGMPAALKSVMGAAASGEALGRVFDSLQVESVARGFMFAIILQGIKAVVQ